MKIDASESPTVEPLSPLISAAELDIWLADIEAKLIEQDHRWISVVMNLYQAFTLHPVGDVRRHAALRAVMWRIFSPATLATVGISIISIAGLLIALQANHLLALQNKRIDQQTLLLEAQRRAGLVTEFTAVVEQMQKEREADTAKAKALGKVVDANKLLTLSGPTVGRIVALSRSYRPYLFLEIDGDADNTLGRSEPSAAAPTSTATGYLVAVKLWLNLDLGTDDDGERPTMTRVALSPERGQLLIALHGGTVDFGPLIRQSVEFSRADLRNAQITAAQLSHVNLTRAAMMGADLLGSDLSSAFMAGANLSRACLHNVTFSGTLMLGVNLSNTALDGAIIMNPEQLEEADLTGANMHGLFVSGAKWLDILRQMKGAPAGFVRADWTLEPITDTHDITELQARVGRGADTEWYQVKATAGVLDRYKHNKSVCS